LSPFNFTLSFFASCFLGADITFVYPDVVAIGFPFLAWRFIPLPFVYGLFAIVSKHLPDIWCAGDLDNSPLLD
jgi:hypothetical protein